jgi:hypothetical protein
MVSLQPNGDAVEEHAPVHGSSRGFAKRTCVRSITLERMAGFSPHWLRFGFCAITRVSRISPQN